MRIISGKYRGKKLRPPQIPNLRPTTDYAKESLFNLLGNRIDLEDIRFLDLFAGTGNISFELMSRGAEGGLCVDISLASDKYRHRMIKEMGLKGLRSVKSEAFKFIRNCPEQFDLIFCDPPYDLKRLQDIPEAIFTSSLLKEDGLLVVEHPEEHTFGRTPHFQEHRRYGRVNFSFFSLEEAVSK